MTVRSARVSTFRAACRLAGCVALVVHGVLTCALRFPFLSPEGRARQVGLFSRRMLGALGLRTIVHGQAQPGPVMLVANHVSWLDILAINAVHTARFVSKSDVRQWPVLGWMVACGGTLFIERASKRDAMRVVHQVAQALQAGNVVAVFPEGTTGDGHGLLPFHANLLQAAVAVGAPVQAVALRYADARSPVSASAAYVGDTTLLRSLWAVVRAKGLVVQVRLLPMEAPAGHDRRSIAEKLRWLIVQSLEGAGPPAGPSDRRSG